MYTRYSTDCCWRHQQLYRLVVLPNQTTAHLLRIYKMKHVACSCSRSFVQHSIERETWQRAASNFCSVAACQQQSLAAAAAASVAKTRAAASIGYNSDRCVCCITRTHARTITRASERAAGGQFSATDRVPSADRTLPVGKLFARATWLSPQDYCSQRHCCCSSNTHRYSSPCSSP
jgi:hypothetical protein